MPVALAYLTQPTAHTIARGWGPSTVAWRTSSRSSLAPMRYKLHYTAACCNSVANNTTQLCCCRKLCTVCIYRVANPSAGAAAAASAAALSVPILPLPWRTAGHFGPQSARAGKRACIACSFFLSIFFISQHPYGFMRPSMAAGGGHPQV